MDNNLDRKPIVETLMARDGITRQEAKAQVKEFKSYLFEMIETDPIGAYDLIQDELGLEPDYLDELIF